MTWSQETLGSVTAEVLEEAAFIFVETVDQPPPFENERLIKSSITFSGPERGSLTIVAPSSFGHNLAANLLGVDASDALATGKEEDALGEILNIIGGALLALVYPGATCQLGVPRVESRTTAQEVLVKPDGVAFLVHLITEEGHRVDASVVIEPSDG